MGSDFCLVFVILLRNHMKSHGNDVKRDALKASSHFFQESKGQKEENKKLLKQCLHHIALITLSM